MPIPAATARAIADASLNQDRVDANQLGELIASDPLMTLELFRHVATLRRSHQLGDPQTVTAAIVWAGIAPFFRAFDTLQILEESLADAAEALRQVNNLIARNRRASRLALAFAVRRADPGAPLLHHAALLHEFAELLLWVHEPQTASDIAALRSTHPDRNRATIERQALGFSLESLQHALSRAWRLPSIFERVNDTRHAEETDSRIVRMAQRFAAADAHPASVHAVMPSQELADAADLLGMLLDDLVDLLTESGA